ncbi:hypothetical protein [Roseiarcus sp.]|uniref:hypothetical protein n=1 Tax=Roseiarcus sp. TaxID=1969460 RepID=UPI003D122D22
MPTNILTRRAALLSLGAFAAAGLGGCNTTPTAGVQPGAAAPAGLRIGAVNVDTAPLVAYVGNPTAGWAQQALPGALAQAFGARMAPGDPGAATLNVRIDTLYLGDGGPGDPDLIRGVAMVGGHTISVRASATYYLAVAFAYRLKRKLGA